MSQFDTRPMCLLSFDGGGIRGLSSLWILNHIMERFNEARAKNGQSHVEPWEVFDMICGSGTGGLAAVMLGRLRMPMSNAIQAYLSLVRLAFSENGWWGFEGYTATRLERAIHLMVGASRIHDIQANEKTRRKAWQESEQLTLEYGTDVMMRDPDESERCQVFLSATLIIDGIDQTSRLRTYASLINVTPSCTIWEALHSTIALPPLFKNASISVPANDHDAWVVSSTSVYANPTQEIIEEAADQHPTRPVACVLSIGTGSSDAIRLRPAGGFPKLRLWRLPGFLRKIVSECEETHNRLSKQPQLQEVYFRFNAGQELQEVGLEEWERPEVVMARTMHYMQQDSIVQVIEKVLHALLERHSVATAEQLAGR
ncbi:patatin-like phospholipase protein [Ceratobasidium sp. AG-Ba]|nr:patatin-like phospholipase protein [Ceratobasidium sp. AG-Ba]